MNKPDHDAATKAANKVVADGRYDNDITDLAIAYLALEQQAPKWVGERWMGDDYKVVSLGRIGTLLILAAIFALCLLVLP